MLYNQLGQVTEINLGNGLRTTYGYYGTGGGYDTSGGYYGRLWEIKTLPQAGGSALQQVQHTWDAGGNLATRNNVLSSDGETFSYDFLDRLTGVSGNYTQSYSYNEIGNILSMNGNSYAYGAKPHAVTTAGTANYTYDSNGNMLTGAGRTIVWDAENRPISITTGNSTATFVYDGDGNRALKTEGGQTTLYINKYYEKSLTSGNATAYYFLGGRLIGMKEGAANVTYVHQDHLTGTSVVSNSAGSLISSIAYAPFGATRAGSVSTDIKFTGQRLDATGLYYYNARYYDPQIGRFISADTIVPDFTNPQALNRYSYVLNNPLKYTDPSGHEGWEYNAAGNIVWVDDEQTRDQADDIDAYWLYVEMQTWVDSAFTQSVMDATYHSMLDTAGMVPAIGEAFDLINAGLYGLEGDWGNAGLSAVAVVPIVGAVGTGAKLTKKITGSVGNITNSPISETLLGRGSNNPIVREAIEKGNKAHLAEDYGSGVSREVGLPSGKRMDGYDSRNKIIYELKPDNSRAIQKGLAQLNTYVNEANKVYGPGHVGILRTYK